MKRREGEKRIEGGVPMNRNEREELIERVLEGEESAAALPDPASRRELEEARRLDALLREAVRLQPTPPCPAALREFRFAPRRRSPFRIPAWAAVAAVLAAALIAVLFLATRDRLPTGDPHELQALLTKAADDSLPPLELMAAQRDLVRFLADNAGSLRGLRESGRMPDLDAVWLRSCRKRLQRALEQAKAETSPGERLAVLEQAFDDCRGVTDEASVRFYRETLSDSRRLMDESVTKWAEGGEADLSWADGVWRPFAVVMSPDNSWKARDIRLAWRAVADGAESSEIAARMGVLPRGVAAAFAVAAASWIARDARYHPALVSGGDILGEAASGIEASLLDGREGVGAFANFTVMPLWTSFFVRKGTLPAKVRIRFGRIENFFDGFDSVMGRKGINPRYVLDEIRAALHADDLYLLNRRPGAAEWRLAQLYNEAAALPASYAEEWRSLVNAVNVLRFLRGRAVLSTVFHHPSSAVETFVAGLSLPEVFSGREAARLLLTGDFDRVHPDFSGAGVALHLFREGGGPVLPDNHLAPPASREASPTSGDFPGSF